MRERWAVIVAGGSGLRMGSDTPKQFMLLAGRPVVIHTLEKFADCHIVLVLPELQIPFWKSLWHQYQSTLSVEDIQIAVGGATRTESVLNGLHYVPDGVLVAIHDAVRPLVSKHLIEECFISADKTGSGVAAVECTDSLRQKNPDSGTTTAVDRSLYLLMQTPQTFRSEDIKRAYQVVCNRNDSRLLTDDATVYEATGNALHFLKGERSNIKITLPVDLRVAEALL